MGIKNNRVTFGEIMTALFLAGVTTLIVWYVIHMNHQLSEIKQNGLKPVLEKIWYGENGKAKQ